MVAIPTENIDTRSDHTGPIPQNNQQDRLGEKLFRRLAVSMTMAAPRPDFVLNQR